MPEEEDPDDLKTPEEHLQEIRDFIRMKGEEQAAEVTKSAELPVLRKFVEEDLASSKLLHPHPPSQDALRSAENIVSEALIIEQQVMPDAILATEEPNIKKMKVAAESGAADHIAHPTSLPGNILLLRENTTRNFVSASGDGIKNTARRA